MSSPVDIVGRPGYKDLLKDLIKSQIQHLITQLLDSTGDESFVITASKPDFVCSVIGSQKGVAFVESQEDIRSKFTGFLKTGSALFSVEVPPNDLSRASTSPQTDFTVTNKESIDRKSEAHEATEVTPVQTTNDDIDSVTDTTHLNIEQKEESCKTSEGVTGEKHETGSTNNLLEENMEEDILLDDDMSDISSLADAEDDYLEMDENEIKSMIDYTHEHTEDNDDNKKEPDEKEIKPMLDYTHGHTKDNDNIEQESEEKEINLMYDYTHERIEDSNDNIEQVPDEKEIKPMHGYTHEQQEDSNDRNEQETEGHSRGDAESASINADTTIQSQDDDLNQRIVDEFNSEFDIDDLNKTNACAVNLKLDVEEDTDTLEELPDLDWNITSQMEEDIVGDTASTTDISTHQSVDETMGPILTIAEILKPQSDTNIRIMNNQDNPTHYSEKESICLGTREKIKEKQKKPGKRKFLTKEDLTCKVCGKHWKHSGHFREHMVKHTGLKEYKCQVCHKEFKWRSAYQGHMKKYHPEVVSAKSKLNTPANIAKNNEAGEETVISKQSPEMKKAAQSANIHNKMHYKIYTTQKKYIAQKKTGAATFHFRKKRNKSANKLVLNDKDKTCQVCEKVCRNLHELKEHEHKHTGIFQCYKCDRTFIERNEFRNHNRVCNVVPEFLLKWMTVKENEKCDDKRNEKEYKNSSKTDPPGEGMSTDIRQTNFITVPKISFYKCRKCQMIFKFKISLKKHKCKANATVQAATNSLDENVPEKKKMHFFTCKNCNRRFQFRISLKKHTCKALSGQNSKKSSPSNNKVVDSSKTTVMTSLSSVSEDVVQTEVTKIKIKNSGEKIRTDDLTCPYCQRVFVTKSHVYRHLVVHTKEKRFKCQYCPEKFLWTEGRTKHERIKHKSGKTKLESKQRPVRKCKHSKGSNITLNADRKKSELNDSRILRDVEKMKSADNHTTSNGKFKCPHCDKEFAKARYVNDHVWIHKNVKRFKCIACNKRFQYRKNESHRETCPGFAKGLESKIIQINKYKKNGPKKNRAEVLNGDKIEMHVGMTKTYAKLNLKEILQWKSKNCPGCEKTYSSAHIARDHYTAEHLGLKRYSCDKCGKCFSNYSTRYGHVKICTGVASLEDGSVEQIHLKSKQDDHLQYVIHTDESEDEESKLEPAVNELGIYSEEAASSLSAFTCDSINKSPDKPDCVIQKFNGKEIEKLSKITHRDDINSQGW